MYGKSKKDKDKGKGEASSCAEDTRELLKLALEEKPNAFREVFDEIMLAKIVDISDEMKGELAQSMFGESSHKYGEDKGGRRRGKNETKHERDNHVGESFEPEDEEEYEEEDEDFDISDEDLEDLDLEDFEDEDEEQIEESVVGGFSDADAKLKELDADKRWFQAGARRLTDTSLEDRSSRNEMGEQMRAQELRIGTRIGRIYKRTLKGLGGNS